MPLPVFLVAGDCAFTARSCLSQACGGSVAGKSGDSSDESEASCGRYSRLSDASGVLFAEPAGDQPIALGEDIDINNTMVLVPRESHFRCVFKFAQRLKADMKDEVGHDPIEDDEGVPLVLLVENADDLAVVPNCFVPGNEGSGNRVRFHAGHYWSYLQLGFGTAEDAAHVSYDGALIADSCSGAVLCVLSGGDEDLKVGMPVTTILGETKKLTRDTVPWNSFTLNEDATISPADAPDLALGFVWVSEEEYADDQETLLSLMRWIVGMGLFNFASLPFTFALAYNGLSILVYVFMAFKIALVGTLQGWTIRRWERFHRSKRYEHMKRIHEGWDRIEFLRTNWVHIIMSLFDIIEIVDPDLDAMSAGTAFTAVTASQAAAYAASYRDIPGLNWVVEHIGLPGMLSAVVIGSSVVQLSMFLQTAERMKRYIQHWPSSGFYMAYSGFCVRWWINHNIFHASDVAGLLAITNVADVLWAYDTTPDPERRKNLDFNGTADRGANFIAKGLFETLPSAWLTISMLSLVVDNASHLVIVQTLFSVGTSYYTALKLLFDTLSHFGRDLLSPATVWAKGHLKPKLVGVVITVLYLVVLSVRLVGVWRCPDHIWNLSSLSCVDLTAGEASFV